MQNLFFYPDLQIGKEIILPSEEARHVKSLRLKKGDWIHLVDGKGGRAQAKVLIPSSKSFKIEIIDFQRTDLEKKHHIHIAVAPTKTMERIEWFVEKAVEIGIDEITFLQTSNSVRKVIKTERLFKKAVEAMKQSLRSRLPLINPFVHFNEFIKQQPNEQRFIAYVGTHTGQHLQSMAAKNGNYCVMIGAEGGFNQEEVNLAIRNGFETVSLGESRLRTETAALSACMILNFINNG